MECLTQRGLRGAGCFSSPSGSLYSSPRGSYSSWGSWLDSIPFILCNGGVCLHLHTNLALSLLPLFSFPAAGASHGKGWAGAGTEQAQSRLPVVCADAPVPKASPVLGDVIQFTLGALGTGCAGWERRNANEIGLGNAAG